ncbi:MAG: nucleotide sugar dehydrogenase [Oligoflexia bacterium]|nr:nucleotide sugar dehydrogenase [Oligoflexia bacterium]
MITAVGLGFVGLTTALGFADRGLAVVGVDNNAERCAEINAGNIPFHEPGLSEALARSLGGKFTVSTSLAQAVNQSRFVFVCVGTPSNNDGSADLSYIKSVLAEVARCYSQATPLTVVIKSTVPPGSTCGELQSYLAQAVKGTGGKIGLVNNPEFLREGCAWKDFMEPDRIVIGADDELHGLALAKLYSQYFSSTVHLVSPNTAEFIKYLSNTLLATLISFSNEMSLIAHAVGNIDIQRAFKIVHQDRRWIGHPAPMTSYAYPGCGFGGYCLPKDTQALASTARAAGLIPRILDSVIAVNSSIREYASSRIAEASTTSGTIGILGLAFKPGSDDIRDTPASHIIGALLRRGLTNIIAYDPAANSNFRNSYNLPIRYADSLDALARESETIAILTAWDEFKINSNVLAGKKVLDFRYML